MQVLRALSIGGGFVALPVIAQEKKADEAKKGTEPAKAKAEKVAGDIGLLDTEKNYMIVVTKEGKLITLDYNTKPRRKKSSKRK